MFDIKWIRDNPEAFDEGLARRSLAQLSADLIGLDASRRMAQTKAQEIQTSRNALSKEIGAAKARGEDAADIIAQVSESKQAEADAEHAAATALEQLEAALAGIPNLPFDDVPVGDSEDDNIEVRKWGEPRSFDFEIKDHVDLGEGLGLMDFERAAKLTGSRFVVLSGALARMERALANFMLNLHTRENGYTEVNPPALVNDATMFGTGQLPKFGEDLFRTEEGYWMIPTAEVPLTNMVAGDILDEAKLPKRMTAMTWCFRSEAGAAGKDTRGMIRQHQFTKVEMVSVTTPDQSTEELERMTGCAEEVLKRLELPYRTVVLCTGDMGFGARKTYDIEVWLPAQDTYREISSCSNCGDFQARRMKARCRAAGEKETRFVHTLNGSGLAVGRTLIAILENYQQADGSVVVPDALRHFMGGIEVITPEGA
ncbi:MAG: serine--tRNA ligase [Rhodospirillaceae bacterium]|jgi:seryl-tRNA synthetase|nr:serine--tRNA ligase [Rhodospirillaceae bacterium]MBT3909703.1 serine--tRNA ligase [Rhodospirillaceae bacterium]MBT5300446.1 serine--tRNA ligase [Rhodospirillaceae bacterium]MBT5515920.1 serine--tRNA ligase [Rhodospirillaceae bacterium]MBT6086349.1 serine--tRNA ligase [Rhodospirillaceae bacterium]